jgi:hypothetical protein
MAVLQRSVQSFGSGGSLGDRPVVRRLTARSKARSMPQNRMSPTSGPDVGLIRSETLVCQYTCLGQGTIIRYRLTLNAE